MAAIQRDLYHTYDLPPYLLRWFNLGWANSRFGRIFNDCCQLLQSGVKPSPHHVWWDEKDLQGIATEVLQVEALKAKEENKREGRKSKSQKTWRRRKSKSQQNWGWRKEKGIRINLI